MSLLTAPSTRVPGLVLMVVLGVLLALTPAPALGTPGDVDPQGVWPLQPQPEVVNGFDPPLEPWGAGHRGVDLFGSAGQPVRAALPGRVTFAGMLAGRGVVVVSHAAGSPDAHPHGATRTTYEPVAAGVTVGDQVAAGGRLGRLQSFGSHCFPSACLHWGWLWGDTYLDPLDLVGGGPVRLLPLWRDAPLPAAAARAPTPSFSSYSLWRSPLLRFFNPVG